MNGSALTINPLTLCGLIFALAAAFVFSSYTLRDAKDPLSVCVLDIIHFEHCVTIGKIENVVSDRTEYLALYCIFEHKQCHEFSIRAGLDMSAQAEGGPCNGSRPITYYQAGRGVISRIWDYDSLAGYETTITRPITFCDALFSFLTIPSRKNAVDMTDVIECYARFLHHRQPKFMQLERLGFEGRLDDDCNLDGTN